MKLLQRQPAAVNDARPEPPGETPPVHAPPEPELRTCKSCGATMEPGQDWCLACGAAAGSYAALSEDQTVPPAQTAAAQSQVAQAPPATTTAPPAATTTTSPTTPTTTSTSKSKLPKVQVPSS